MLPADLFSSARRPTAADWRDALRRTAAGPTGTKVLARADDPDPARAAPQAEADLAAGADGLALAFAGGPTSFGYGLPARADSLDPVLRALAAKPAALRLDAHPGNRNTVEDLAAALNRARVDPRRLDLSLGLDPAAVFAGTGRLRMSIAALEASMPQSLAHFFALGLPAILLEADSRVFHNAGAAPHQELGAMLSGALGFLRLLEDARQPLVYAAPHIGFVLALDQDRTTGRRKLHALRALWSVFAARAGLGSAPARVHAETSRRMLTASPDANLARTAAAALAAFQGGAASLAVLPATLPHGLPDAAARRQALLLALTLRDETQTPFPTPAEPPTDPAADPTTQPTEPADALSDATALVALCEAAWAESERLDAEGGLLRSLERNRFQARVLDARAARAASLSAGAAPIVGTTRFPTPPVPVSTLPAPRQPVPTEGIAVCLRLDPTPDDTLLSFEPEPAL